MTQEQIKNFNYRAFLMLIRKNQELTDMVKKSGYSFDSLSDFIDLNQPILSLNNGFKQALLKIYRTKFEEGETDFLLLDVFEKLCKAYPMIEERNYRQEARELEQDMSNDIQKELKRIGRVFSKEDDKPIESLTYNSTSELEAIYPDGSALYNGEKTTIFSLIDDGKLALYDAISLLDDLRLTS